MVQSGVNLLLVVKLVCISALAARAITSPESKGALVAEIYFIKLRYRRYPSQSHCSHGYVLQVRSAANRLRPVSSAPLSVCLAGCAGLRRCSQFVPRTGKVSLL
jgi:hypothetical protein